MRKLLLSLLFLAVSFAAFSQATPTGSKTRWVNGVYFGTKSDAAFGTADSLVLYTKLDSTLMFKYKGTARALAYAVSGGYLPISDTSTMLSKYVNTYSNQTSVSGTKTWNQTQKFFNGATFRGSVGSNGYGRSDPQIQYTNEDGGHALIYGISVIAADEVGWTASHNMSDGQLHQTSAWYTFLVDSNNNASTFIPVVGLHVPSGTQDVEPFNVYGNNSIKLLGGLTNMTTLHTMPPDNTVQISGNFRVSTSNTFANYYPYEFKEAVGIQNASGSAFDTTANLGVINLGNMSNGISLNAKGTLFAPSLTLTNLGVGSSSDSILVTSSGVTKRIAQSSMTGSYVPYTGATGPVNLGANSLSAANTTLTISSGANLTLERAGGSSAILTTNSTVNSGLIEDDSNGFGLYSWVSGSWSRNAFIGVNSIFDKAVSFSSTIVSTGFEASPVSWEFGKVYGPGGLSLNTTNYISVKVGGITYKLALVN